MAAHAESLPNAPHYIARWYDPTIARFAQADSVVPDPANPRAYDRYAYSADNPVRYNDPTGHRSCEEDGYGCSGQWIVFVGSFRAGLTASTLAERAEEAYTGGTNGGAAAPINGVSPRVPLLPGKPAYGLWDPSGPASVASDIAGIGNQDSADDVAVFMRYSRRTEQVSIQSLYIDNRSDQNVYLLNVGFLGTTSDGKTQQAYQYSCDSCIGTHDDPYIAIVRPHSEMEIGLYGTALNPTNTFSHARVQVTTTFRDPSSAVRYPTFRSTVTAW